MCTWRAKQVRPQLLPAPSLECSLVQESHPHKIASSPNDLAAANVVKIVEREFKVQGQDIEVVQLNSGAALCNVAYMATKHAALLVEEQQRILRDCRSGDGSSLVIHLPDGKRSRIKELTQRLGY